jgi:alpha-L-rhamnosidase
MRAWTASWVEPLESSAGGVQRPVQLLIGSFAAPLRPVQAELRITAHGIYEAFLNGTRIGDAELTPGFTAYRRRLQVQTYDVTALLQEGENVLGARLSDGWWRGQNGIGRRSDAYGTRTALLAELTARFEDGTTTVFGTDGFWLSTPSHFRADLIAGEVHDLRREDPAWANPGQDRSGWAPVTTASHGFDNLVETVGPPVRRTRELRAESVRRYGTRHIVDFGQVVNGWVRLRDLGPADSQLTLVHGECLSPAGDDVQIDAFLPGAGARDDWAALSFQTDVVISRGDGSVFEPRHSTKGFRYVRVDGHVDALSPDSITALVVHSDLEPIGSFACSDDDLNWLHAAADWSLRTNVCDIPTDCPTRERAGWTGDWQIFAETAAFLYDISGFSEKWLLDVAAEQLPNGAVLHFVPDPADHADPALAFWSGTQGSAGWGDAIVHVPWELYRSTGDVTVLERFFEPMRSWVEFARSQAASGRHPARAAARPQAGEHERYLWDTGFHFGEWNEPGTDLLEKPPSEDEPADGLERLAARFRALDHGPTATAYLWRSARELADAAEVLGKPDVAAHYRELAHRVRDAWRAEFVDADGHVQPATQPNLVRALAFDLVPEEHRGAAQDDLAALVRAADGHLGTGFLATPFLLPVLADAGQLDLAYQVLLQRTPPSWLAMRDQGATTLWESWTPFDSEGRVKESLNHFSMGAVVSFLHQYVAGLQPLEPGYRRFLVAPQPGAGVTWATTHHDSPHGRIAVEWRLTGEVGHLSVEVPPGTLADVRLPSGELHTLDPGSHALMWPPPTQQESPAEKELSG